MHFSASANAAQGRGYGDRQLGGPVAVALCDEFHADFSHALFRLCERGTGPRLRRQATGYAHSSGNSVVFFTLRSARLE
jgi:hypothetical protein